MAVDTKKRLEKNKKLHRKLKEYFGHTYILTQENIVEKRLKINFDNEKLHQFIGFVGRGLLWHHWEKLLPLSCSFRVFTPSATGIAFISNLFNLSSNLRVEVQLGDYTIRYKGVMSETDEGVSIWAIQLLGGITVTDETGDNIFHNSFVVMITGPPEILERLEVGNAT